MSASSLFSQIISLGVNKPFGLVINSFKKYKMNNLNEKQKKNYPNTLKEY